MRTKGKRFVFNSLYHSEVNTDLGGNYLVEGYNNANINFKTNNKITKYRKQR